MTKRIISFLLILSALCCVFGCNPNNSTVDEPTGTTNATDTWLDMVDQTETDFIVRADWMTFYFSKKDFNESDIKDIAAEANSVMADIRNHLNVNYTAQEAAGAVCCFDSTYRNEDGQKRSKCFWDENKMYCISLDDFVHEYVHLISENNADLAYHPSELFNEGLAQYVSLNFYDGIATKEYEHFKEETVSENSNATEHQTICRLLSDNKLAYNAENYNKAFVALLDKSFDISKLDTNGDFYKYYIGHVFVDYCINQLGGLEKFISVYCDSVTFSDVYGKSVDDLVVKACEHNTNAFYKNHGEKHKAALPNNLHKYRFYGEISFSIRTINATIADTR